MDYPALVQFTDGFLDELVPLPMAADDVCPHCQSWKRESDELCWSCERVVESIGRPCPLVIPISFYMTPDEGEPRSPFRERMHDYKEHDDPSHRAENAEIVGGILSRYLVENEEELRRVTGGWDVMTTVPSKRGRLGRPPLAVALQPFENLVGTVRDLLAPGPGSVSHYSPHEKGFIVTGGVDGTRVLLLDDTFTTGATLQSAAHALNGGGAQVVAGVVVARKISPASRYTESTAVWDRQHQREFSFSDELFWTRS